MGSTGVGKTELVKQLAADLFNTPDALIRLDMSEFMEKHSVSRLVGSPPGYVGYDEAGQLTEKIRRKPYSVILFDEIEKAHPDVLNILLQILDDGEVTDAHGRKVNFENTVIVMTSNAGSDKAAGSVGFGRGADDQGRERTMKALREFLRPEFINRVDEIVYFHQLTEENFAAIARIMLDELRDSLREKGIPSPMTTRWFPTWCTPPIPPPTGPGICAAASRRSWRTPWRFRSSTASSTPSPSCGPRQRTARCGWIRCKEGGFMLFRKDIEPRRAYCAQGVCINETQVACVKKGIVSAENHCFRFRYDPLKRVPPRPAQLSTDGLKEEDFSL